MTAWESIALHTAQEPRATSVPDELAVLMRRAIDDPTLRELAMDAAREEWKSLASQDGNAAQSWKVARWLADCGVGRSTLRDFATDGAWSSRSAPVADARRRLSGHQILSSEPMGTASYGFAATDGTPGADRAPGGRPGERPQFVQDLAAEGVLPRGGGVDGGRRHRRRRVYPRSR
jgi:hypothetical protein